MIWRRRFEALVDELAHTPGVTVREALIGSPTDPATIAAAKATAGAAWPEGMSELYADLSFARIAYEIEGSEGNGGSINLPRVTDIWDHASHEDELWFDWLVEENPDHPFLKIRPIDRFLPEACAVLYPVPPDGSASQPAMVHYHYCGEELIPTDLTYLEWLECLLRSRGAHYWMKLTTGRANRRTWVEENIDRVAALFPSFDPPSMMPRKPKKEILF